jgi:hypothetical protein
MHTVQLLGNLTLLTQRLNSKVSNGPWDGPSGKRALLKANTSILITKELDELGADGWNDELIHERTQRLIDDILQIWPVPTGHTGSVTGAIEKATQTVELADLVQAGILEAGQTLWARRKAHLDTTAQVANDGSLFIDGKSFQYPSSAAVAVTGGQSEAGWWFWVTEREGDRSLSDLRREYVESLDADLGDEED